MAKNSEKHVRPVLTEIDLQKNSMILQANGDEEKEKIRNVYDKIRDNCEKVMENSLKELE